MGYDGVITSITGHGPNPPKVDFGWFMTTTGTRVPVF
jgi:hypothetical protein